jgi:hypothetical protein
MKASTYATSASTLTRTWTATRTPRDIGVPMGALLFHPFGGSTGVARDAGRFSLVALRLRLSAGLPLSWPRRA